MKVKLKGESYEMRELRPEDVVPGALVRFGSGSVMRRIVGFDGDEAILRGVVSADVFEAVDVRRLVDEWNLLVSAEA